MDNIFIRMKGMKRDEESLLRWKEPVHFGSTAHLSSVLLLFVRGTSVCHHGISVTKCTHVLDVCTYKMGLLVFSPSKQVTLGVVLLLCTCHPGLTTHSSLTPLSLTQDYEFLSPVSAIPTFYIVIFITIFHHPFLLFFPKN